MTVDVASAWTGFPGLDAGCDADFAKNLDLFASSDQLLGLTDADFGFLLGDALGMDVEAPGTPVPDAGLDLPMELKQELSGVPEWTASAGTESGTQPPVQAGVVTTGVLSAGGAVGAAVPAVTTGHATRLRTTAPALPTVKALVQFDDLAGTASPATSGTNSMTSESGDYSDAAPAKKDPRIGKRKPAVDLSKITDVEERRKQRRLIKNRATAALSRERKRALMANLQTRVRALEQENSNLTHLLSCRDAEIARLQKVAGAQ